VIAVRRGRRRQSPIRACTPLFELVSQVAAADITVPLAGSRRVGKAVFAEAIHRKVGSRDKPVFSLNCAALARATARDRAFGYDARASPVHTKPIPSCFASPRARPRLPRRDRRAPARAPKQLLPASPRDATDSRRWPHAAPRRLSGSCLGDQPTIAAERSPAALSSQYLRTGLNAMSNHHPPRSSCVRRGPSALRQVPPKRSRNKTATRGRASPTRRSPPPRVHLVQSTSRAPQT